MATTRSFNARRPLFQAILDVRAAAEDSTPVPILALMAVLFEDLMAPARLDEHGYEITDTCTLSEMPFSPEQISTIERWMQFHCAPDATCDECGLRMGGDVPAEELNYLEPSHIFSLTTSGFKSYFICDWCAEKWESDGEAGIPSIMGKINLNRVAA